MEDWVKRMNAELEELDGRIERLGHFLKTDEYDKLDTDQQLLDREQLAAMKWYARTLSKRLKYEND